MKAELKCYKGNADLFVDGGFYVISWDGWDWDTVADWEDWAKDKLSPARAAENYQDLKHILYIHTNHLINE